MLLDNGRDKDRNRREREKRGDDVSRNVSPPTTATGDEVDYGVAHTRGISVKLNPKYFLIVQREEGRKENLPSDRRAHYSSMTKWRWKNREKE
jgi:hypothetical protein